MSLVVRQLSDDGQRVLPVVLFSWSVAMLAMWALFILGLYLILDDWELVCAVPLNPFGYLTTPIHAALLLFIWLTAVPVLWRLLWTVAVSLPLMVMVWVLIAVLRGF